MFPNIISYIESMSASHRCLDSLADISAIIDTNGIPYYISGNNGVVFKVAYRDEHYAMKCYTRNNYCLQKHYQYLTKYLDEHKIDFICNVEFFADEILAGNPMGGYCHYPVVMSKWIEGINLGQTIQKSIYFNDRDELNRLADNFLLFAFELLQTKFSHGDLKHDNIIIDETGKLILIDLDAAYTPNMCDCVNTEMGSAWYQHPSRQQDILNSNRDNYSIALISASIIALGEEPHLYSKYNNGENIIFDPIKILAGTCDPYNYLIDKWKENIVYTSMLNILSKKHDSAKNIISIMRALLTQRGVTFIDSEIFKPISRSTTSELSMVVDKSGKYGFIDKEGVNRIATIYSDAKDFSENLAAVYSDTQWYFIDYTGKRVSSESYQNATSFKEGLAAVKLNKKWGYIDYNCEIVISPRFAWALPFKESLAAVSKDGKQYYYINKHGKRAFSGDFLYAKSFSNGKAIVKDASGYFIIDTKGLKIKESI